MSLNRMPAGSRMQIGFFGLRNAGKSSLVNRITGQQMSLVSAYAGTTTDPVRKTMELLPVGPVVIIDTPGLDDSGPLGELRVKKTREVLRNTDLAVLVLDGGIGIQKADRELIRLFKKSGIPFLIAANKADQTAAMTGDRKIDPAFAGCTVSTSAKTGYNIDYLKDRIAELAEEEGLLTNRVMIQDMLKPGDSVVLVIPIDSAAPKDRLILPQQMAVREILDAGGTAVCVKDTELASLLKKLPGKPELVITDSQAFSVVSKTLTEDIPLTSFSILMARKKGNLREAVHGAEALRNLRDGDRILIAEGCTHHRQCDDIGTVKMPGWIREYSGAAPEFVFTSGRTFPEDLKEYRLIVHCGGCMLNEKEMQYRYRRALEQGVPVINYGIAIAACTGILERSLQPLGITAKENPVKK